MLKLIKIIFILKVTAHSVLLVTAATRLHVFSASALSTTSNSVSLATLASVLPTATLDDTPTNSQVKKRQCIDG